MRKGGPEERMRRLSAGPTKRLTTGGNTPPTRAPGKPLRTGGIAPPIKVPVKTLRTGGALPPTPAKRSRVKKPRTY